MTIQSRTIRIPMDPLTELGTTLTATSSIKNIPIPMTTSRVFRDVRLEVNFHSGTGVVLSTTETRIGVKLGAVGTDIQTVTKTITNTGEDYTLTQIRDVTAYFAANFGAGTTQTFNYTFGSTYATGTFSEISAVLVINFEWDDATGASTRVKTVPFVLDNNLLLTASLQQIGGGNLQIPVLNTVLGESTKVFQHIWFEIDSNRVSTSAAASNLQVALDAEAALTIDAGNITNSSFNLKYRWIRNDLVTTASHTFSIASSVGNQHSHARIVMWVTYTYNHTASTRITNHVRLPWSIEGVVSGDATKPSRANVVASIPEPGAITVLNAGVSASYHSNPSGTRRLNWRVGSQAFRLFDETSATIMVGPMFVGLRFDAAAQGGAGLTIGAGENKVVIDVYQEAQADTDGVSLVGWCCGWVDIVYTSDKHASGDGVHSTVYERTLVDRNQPSALIQRAVSGGSPAVPFTANYYRQGTGWEYQALHGSLSPSVQITQERKVSGGEGGPAWDLIGAATAFVSTTAELTSSLYVCPNDGDLTRYVGEVIRTVIAHDARTYLMMMTTASLHFQLTMTTTFHRIKTTKTGTVSGYASGNGSGIVVAVFRGAEFFTSTVTGVGGTFSFDVWDNATNYFAFCAESNRVGISLTA